MVDLRLSALCASLSGATGLLGGEFVMAGFLGEGRGFGYPLGAGGPDGQDDV
jgi:hypothetical protein